VGLVSIDVSVVHPTSKSYLKGAQKTLGAAKETYKEKLKHYQEWIEIQEEDLSRHVLVPFIMETYGAFHRQAKRLLERVCDIMHDNDPDYAQYACKQVMKRCSVALQKGNARIIMKGCKLMHCSWA